jgi:hypothetical protein
MMHARLQRHLEMNSGFAEAQYGFRTGRSCIHLLVALRTFLDMRVPVYAVFLDVVEAYDSAHRATMLMHTRMSGVRGRLYRFISASLVAARRCVYVSASERSRVFADANGVLQGCESSPTLYSAFVCRIAHVLVLRGHGVWLVGVLIAAMLYADDFGLFALADPALSDMLMVCGGVGGELGVRFNDDPSKSAVVVFRPPRGRVPRRWALNDTQLLSERDSYKYLGVLAHASHGFHRHVASLCNAVYQAARDRLLAPLHISGVPLPASEAIKLYTIYVRPIFEYGAAAWWPSLPARLRSRVIAVQNRILRDVLGLFKSTPLCAVYLDIGLLPLDARLDEVALLQWALLTGSDRHSIAGAAVRQQVTWVDDGQRVRGSWGSGMLAILQRYGLGAFWHTSVPDNWPRRVREAVRRVTAAGLMVEVRGCSSLITYLSLHADPGQWFRAGCPSPVI